GNKNKYLIKKLFKVEIRIKEVKIELGRLYQINIFFKLISLFFSKIRLTLDSFKNSSYHDKDGIIFKKIIELVIVRNKKAIETTTIKKD
ncbi:hypothetical protein NQ643_13375, partial [Acinetobacter baumannii]|nr:hypothetical protein [Acinetobacter baumannii]